MGYEFNWKDDPSIAVVSFVLGHLSCAIIHHMHHFLR